ncbi:MAG TPA: hypothetical protein VI386_04360 [Candidatus Sulfotelmatobacter sp.]
MFPRLRDLRRNAETAFTSVILTTCHLERNMPVSKANRYVQSKDPYSFALCHSPQGILPATRAAGAPLLASFARSGLSSRLRVLHGVSSVMNGFPFTRGLLGLREGKHIEINMDVIPLKPERRAQLEE